MQEMLTFDDVLIVPKFSDIASAVAENGAYGIK